MALLFYYRVRWRYCSSKHWLEDLDLDGSVLRYGRSICLLLVP
jgi:hypothetical protein